MKRLVVAFIALVLFGGDAVAQSLPLPERSGRERYRNAPNRPERDRDEELAAKRRIEADLEQAQFHASRLYLISRFELADIGIGSELYIPADEQLDGAAISVRAPQRLYWVANRRVLFSADAVPGYVFYVDSDRGDQLSWKLRGDVHFLFPFFYVNVFGSLSDELIRDNSELARLVPRDTTQWGVNTEFKPSSRTSLELSYLVDDIDFDENDENFFDERLNLLERTARKISFEGRHHTFPITHTLLGAELTDYEFPQSGIRDSEKTFLYLGADREIAGRHLVGRVGYANLDYFDSSARDYSGVLGDVKLGIVLNSRNRLSLQYKRDLEFSIFENNRHYLADRLFLNDTHDLTHRLTLHLQGQAGTNSYEVPVATFNGPVKRQDELYFIGAGPSYQFLNWLRLGFVVGPWERHSNIPGESANGIRWHILLSFN